MADKKPRDQFPRWVKFTLFGLPTRASAWLCFWVSLLLAGISTIVGLWQPLFFLGLSLLLAAYGYWRAILWVDQHGQWQ